jgi:glycosyltransferase involved in cell wall biosynthesis
VSEGARPAPPGVLFVTTSYPRFDGDFAGHFVESLAREIASSGAFVTVLAPHEKGIAEKEERDGVSVRRFRYWWAPMERVAYGDGIPANIRGDWRAALALPVFAVRMRLAVARFAAGADVVHVQWGPTAAIAGAALSGKPVVLTLHGSDTTLARRGGIWRRLLQAGLVRATRVIAVSAEQADFLAAEGLWTGPVDIIPSGVPVELLERERSERASGEPFTYLFVGRLIPEKGVGSLIDAFAFVVAARPDVRLRILGGGPEVAALGARVAAAGLGERVTFLGSVPHRRALREIASADAFVLPSLGEGSPLSVTEALALGTPVVSTRVGALPELLGEDGLFFEPGDVAGLSAAMERLAGDPGLCTRLAAEGRARVRERYTWPVIAARTLDVYREAMGG